MAHPDLNALKDTLLPIAKQMLAEDGEFFPYGAFMTLSGEIVDSSADDKDERPPSRKLFDLLTEDFRRRAAKGEIRAAGICADVRVARPGETEKTDAVHFALEHENGEALDVFLPYSLDSANDVVYGELFATRRVKQFFA
jgi:hypothetical protein